MRKPTRKPNCADVARCLQELEALFGRKRPPENENAQRELGADAAESKLPADHTKNSGGAL